MPANLVPREPTQPVDLTIRDYKSDQALGRASLYGDIANAAAEKICGLYGKSPSSLVRMIPFGSGAIDNSRGVFDDLCAPNQLPPAPTPQFSGGQCDAVPYRVKLAFRTQRGANIPDCELVEESILAERNFAYGPVSDIHLEVGAVLPGTCQIFAYREVWCTCRGTGPTGPRPLGRYQITGSGANNILAITSIALERADGQPDICGNPAPSYPPPSADPGDFEGDKTIVIAPGVQVTVPVKIVPTFAPVVGIFRPEFNVNVGGINVNISPGGFTFSPTVEISPNDPYPYDDPRTVKPPSVPIKPPSSGSGTECDLSEVLTELHKIYDEVYRCCDRDAPHSPPESQKVASREYLMEDSMFQSLPARTFQVTVDLLTHPNQEKVQFSRIGPNVIYAGWFWFSAGNHFSERMPVDAEFKVYSPPDRITDSFACTLYKGYTARVTAYYIKPSS